jgi:glycogen debranching enzyme
MNKLICFGLLLTLIFSCQPKEDSVVLYQSDAYTLYSNKVVQGKNTAEVVSSNHLKSNYKSPASENFSRLIKFKISINEKDNELPPGQDHWVVINDEHTSPVVVFGEKPQPAPASPETFLPTNYQYTFNIDVSPVLKQFDEKGYYEAYDGTKVAKADFKGFYIAGGSEPLSWDFVNLENKGLKLSPTTNPTIYSITVTFNPYNESDFQEKEWKLEKDLSNRPQYQSNQPIVDALFNLSLEEAIKAIEPDSTFRTGAKWAGVWTRDISYSILLAFAYHEPEVAKISLRKKVKRGRIVQDTGSGGAWPVSSDRTTWVLAAWEIYKVTGDKAWLDEIYPIIKNTLEDDYKTFYDKQTGMYSGESSFLDWREQTYPKWMSNMDIYVSQNLGTNAVHYQAHKILAAMAALKGESGAMYDERAEKIKKGINDYLWQADKGYYAQYLYGRTALTKSPRFEALGEALSILFDVADTEKAKSILSKSPVTEFGVTCIYPQIPGIPPYHNNAIWPFVQSYWNLAAAKTGNEAALTHGLASLYRAGAMFLTNYENFVAQSGDYNGTEINSDRMLWSMAGNLAMVHRVFMGMSFDTTGLYFNPVVPKVYAGEKTLRNFSYRNAQLYITVKGFGNKIKTVILNGQKIEKAFLPTAITGVHELVIELANNDFEQQSITKVANHFSLPAPQPERKNNFVTWTAIKDATQYHIYKNGTRLTTTTQTQFEITDSCAEFAVSAADESGYESFISEPMLVAGEARIIEAETFAPGAKLPYSNFSGKGFIETTSSATKNIVFKVNVKEAGNYLLDVRYSNGSGPWNTDNKCAIRSLSVNGTYEGVLVFPQRGKDEWSDWGFSNSRKVQLKAGENTVVLSFEDWNNNMNVDVNRAMLDYLRVMKCGE